MCEFCVQHGEGKRWYLNARNYGEDLESDLRRRRFVRDFFQGFNDWGRRNLRDMERLGKAPWPVRAMVRWQVSRQMKKQHFGQIVSIEEVEQVFGIVNSVARLPCVCRRITRGQEARYCFGISASPGLEFAGDLDPSYWSGPDGHGLEQLSKQEALGLMRGFESEGLVHSVWTFVTPFIGGVCNCDRSDCLAMISTVGHDVPMMFKGHFLAAVDWDKCTGCRSCMRECQFGAIGYSAAARKCLVDAATCYGCGVCRSACQRDAIALSERTTAHFGAK
jgi:NAD-dependent dihydropyrimidine dehydrogenase PreA subunit